MFIECKVLSLRSEEDPSSATEICYEASLLLIFSHIRLVNFSSLAFVPMASMKETIYKLISTDAKVYTRRAQVVLTLNGDRSDIEEVDVGTTRSKCVARNDRHMLKVLF